MKLLTIAQNTLILFFYLLCLPFAFFISCFKLALTKTDSLVDKSCDTVSELIERRKK